MRRRSTPALRGASLLAILALLFTLTPLASHADLYEDGAPIPARFDDLLPVLDSPTGFGQHLPADGEVSLPVGDGEAHSALVRLSVFNAAADLQLLAAGAPALSVAAGASASTTVLVPVSDGEFAVTATHEAASRVEVLATFGGRATTPGATNALPVALTRDSAQVTVGPTTPATFGLTGLGGIPVDGVRTVHVTLTAVATQATTVTLGGQALPVAAGTTTVSTALIPSGAGAVEVTADAAVELRLDIRGWVPGATDQPNNGPGSYWPEPTNQPAEHEVGAAAIPVTAEGRADASHLLALVWAEPTGRLTALEAGDIRPGRTRGAVLDPTAGAQPQLAIVPGADAAMVLHRGTTTAHVQVLGSFIGADVVPAEFGGFSVDTPAEGDVDLGNNLTVTFTGRFHQGNATPQRISVSHEGEFQGYATLRPDGDGVAWEFTTGIRTPGERTYVFEAVTRDGRRAIGGWTGTFTIPGEDDVILQDDVQILGRSDDDPVQLELTDDAVLFATDPGFLPGEVVVSDATDAAPAGFLRRVRAVDETDAGFLVHTGPATLEDVFLQVKRQAWQPILNEPRSVELPANEPGDIEITGHEVASADEAFVELAHDGEMEAVLDDELIDEPPTDWDGRAGDEDGTNATDGAGTQGATASGFTSDGMFVPMARPVPDPPSPEDDQGGQPPKGKEPPRGESELVDLFEFKLQDKGEKGGVAYDVKLMGYTSVAMEFVFVLEIETRWFGFLPYPAVKQFESSLLTKAQVKLEGDLDVTGQWDEEFKSSVPLVKFPSITVPIGPIPLVVSFDVDLTIRADLKISAKFHLGFTQVSEAWFKIGAQYRNDRWASINEGATKFNDPVMDAEAIFVGQVRASAGPELSAGILLYDSFGPRVGFGLKAGVEMDAKFQDDNIVAQVKLYFSGNVFVRATLKVPIIGVTLSDVELLRADLFRWNILDWTYDYHELTGAPKPDPDPDPGDPGDPDPGDPGDPDPGDPGDPGSEPMDALEFARAIQVRELIYPGDDAWYEDRVPVSAEWIDGPPTPGSAAIVEGDFSLPGHITGPDGGIPANQFEKGRYPVLATGNPSFWGDAEPSGGKPGPEYRGEDVSDSTTLKITFPELSRAGCVSIAVLAGDSGEGGVFAAEWGDTSWQHWGDYSFGSDHALNETTVNQWGRHYSPGVTRMSHGDPDTEGSTDFRFGVTRWQISGPLREGNSLYLSTAVMDPWNDGSAMAIESITFIDDYLCDREPSETRQLWSVNGEGR